MKERTHSVCLVCLRPVEAARIRRKNEVYLCKECPEHGAFTVPIWRGGKGVFCESPADAQSLPRRSEGTGCQCSLALHGLCGKYTILPEDFDIFMVKIWTVFLTKQGNWIK